MAKGTLRQTYSDHYVNTLKKYESRQESQVNKYNLNIDRLNKQIDDYNSKKSDYLDSMGKNSDYEKASKRSDSIQKQIDNAEGRSITSKSSYTQKKDKDRIEYLKKERKQYVQKMDSERNNKNKASREAASKSIDRIDEQIKEINDSISSSGKVDKDKAAAKAKKIADLKKEQSKYKDIIDKNNKANAKAKADFSRNNANIKNAMKAIENNKELRAKHKKKMDKWKNMLSKNNLNIRHNNAIKNAGSIADKISNGKKQSKGCIYIYQADKQSSDVVQLVETDPSESGSISIATTTVDNKLPTASYGNPDVRTSSGTYRAIDADTMTPSGDICAGEKDRESVYLKLIHWADTITELNIVGFSKWKHAFIQSFGKQSELASSANTTVISLSFNLIKLSKIETSKTKKGKNLGKKNKKPGSSSKNNPSRTKAVKIKSGDTEIGIAKRMHVPLKQVMDANKNYDPRKLPIGGKLRI